MNRIDRCFAKLKQDGKRGFIAYATAGDPDPDSSLEVAFALERAGVDILEWGVPFSDPLADGIVNQMAAGRALAAGTTPPVVFDLVRRLRRRSEMPVVLYTYLNPVYVYGAARFFQDAEKAGVDGILLLDLPPDEAARNAELQVGSAVAMIRLVAPTTSAERLPGVVEGGSGFIYCISREGVTGEQGGVSGSIAARVAEIRRHTAVPVAVGFGISTPEQAAEVARVSDAVVVGSAIVRRVGEGGSAAELAARVETFVRPMVEATKSAPPATF